MCPASSRALLSPGPDLEVPGYTIERLLGRGSMGAAYLARGADDCHRIVLKIVQLGAPADSEQLKRFMLEYKVVSRIDHPHVIRIEERGFGSEFAFIAMEYCAFGDLRERIKQGLAPREALEYLRQIAAGLGAVHETQVAHRDMKPSNLMFKDPRTLVLTDFGVAKDLVSHEALTARGTFPGSLYYVSPEQIESQETSYSTDLYSVGVMLYQMLMGRPPYVGKTAAEILAAHLHAPIPRLPPALALLQPLIDGLLAKDTGDRFQCCADLMTGITWTACRMD